MYIKEKNGLKEDFASKTPFYASDKNELLPIYVWILLSHYKDPY